MPETAEITRLVAQILGEEPINVVTAERPATPRLPQVVRFGEGRVRITQPYDEAALPLLRAIPGRRYVSGNINEADLCPEVIEFARRFDLVVAPDVEEALTEAIQALAIKREAEAVLAAASVASSVPEEVASRIALSQYLYDFQVAGAAYALNALRTWIADQMGLGKTRQALAVVVTMDARPTLWVCKANLKSNIYAELTGRTPDGQVALKADGTPQDVLTTDKVVILDGQTPTTIDPDAKDVIVNYDIVWFWKDALIQHGFAAIIVDESHYVKNVGTPRKPIKRTAAITEITADIRNRMGDLAVVLFLTGTPEPNRTVELIHQLKLLGRLEEIAPTPWKASGPNGTYTERDYEFSFKFRYCDPVRTPHGWKFEGASNTEELNAKLRQTCMVRRLRKEVTNLKDTLRQHVWIAPGAAEMAIYRELEDELADACADDPTGAAALRMVTMLKQAVGIAKIPAAIEWIEDFLEQNPGEKAIVFAHHVEVQEAIARKFGCPQIKAGQKRSDLDAAKREFMGGDARLIVISMEAGSEGHNLTAAKHVIFVERAWTPSREEQGEDRANRIGQDEANTVTAWYLMAPGTIDPDIDYVVGIKRRNITAVVDGARPDPDAENEDHSRLAVLRRLLDRRQPLAA